MKKFITILLLVIVVNHSFSQREKVLNLATYDDRPIRFGFYLGTNQNGLKISYKPNSITKNPEVIIDSKIGFNVGLIADVRLHKNINLRFEPGLVSNNKTLIFKHIEGPKAKKTREIGNTYMHLPFVFKFSTDRLNNIRPYVLGGLSYNYNFSSNQKNSNDNFFGEFRQKSNSLMYEIGIGIDLYLANFKFSPSIRGLFAISNEIKYDEQPNSPWTDPIDFMGTRGVFLHLSFH